MSHVISMHRPSDPRETAISDLSKVTLCLVASRFEHRTLVVRAKQHNHSIIAACCVRVWVWVYSHCQPHPQPHPQDDGRT
jgi:hypothetical protein